MVSYEDFVTFYYNEENFGFEYSVLWSDVLDVLNELSKINGYNDFHEYCKKENFKDEYELYKLFKDDVKDYFYEEAVEWYRDNKQ